MKHPKGRQRGRKRAHLGRFGSPDPKEPRQKNALPKESGKGTLSGGLLLEAAWGESAGPAAQARKGSLYIPQCCLHWPRIKEMVARTPACAVPHEKGKGDSTKLHPAQCHLMS